MNDYKQFLNEIEQRGWTIERKGKHLKLKRPGHRLVTAPKTPSEPRALANMRAQIKREERRAELTEVAKADPEVLDELYQGVVDEVFAQRAIELSLSDGTLP